MKKILGLAAGLLLTAGALSALPAQAAPPASVDWGACENRTLQAYGAQCGFLSVPLDYSRPRGEKIQLAVSIVRHKSATSQGVMLTNPGGPGGSGLIYSVLGQALLPGAASDSYDWIGFDPRGVGSSKPSLSCVPGYAGWDRPNYVPTTRKLEETWLQRSKAYADACEDKNSRALLGNMKTTDTVRDMDAIRAALGEKQINFYGFSYGTYLGQVYATLFPDRVRRFVLDSNVDPSKVWYQANLDQDVAFDRNIKIWFRWVADNDATFHLGTDAKKVERLWYAQLPKLDAKPAGGKIGPDEWTDIFLDAGYYVYNWSLEGKAFSDWVLNGDEAAADQLIDLYGFDPATADDNGFAVYNAVQCTDVQWPRSWSKWRRDNWATYAKAPFETWANAWFNAPCLFWPAKAGKPVDVKGKKAPPVLLIGETDDAATPFAGGLAVRRLFPRSVLVEGVGGTTHAGSLSGVACVDDTVASYLLDGTLPARKPGNRSDLRCDPVPRPPAGDAYPAAETRKTAPALPRPGGRG
ncbi:alpha/beta hydrolase [Actinocorallia longicatena]|uniref:Alpha/beta hydrolase n=1 Tax=Actinocorallia longicatena TaxID=111803 RepID=A0ABP6Q840_9ACTN